MLRPHPSHPLRGPLWAWVLGAMLLTQTFGLAHRIEHAGEPHSGKASHLHAQASLFDAHGDAADCGLFDHLCLADAASAAPPSTQPGALTGDTSAQPLPTAARRPDRAHLARGPPSQA